ncbi:DUF2975 domain-containing protein [Aurantiacibacter gangjinensis]|uniref:Uncharacterized protein n=1 Tax=Aurantiacibacter gangjinensis TaxID=502682 RepID=A0A0G9MLZ6_9SPHN|nr:DUF2975 domain-containing protein [Aurantiacibacter gangjinensis]APE27759.1 hypothetical protein BMF35_a0930 [Aurantiacibacter gangjinensis]KLE31756.1 hypothetical protein AAW01_09630 [Aurantiacibacter gangjinensis]
MTSFKKDPLLPLAEAIIWFMLGIIAFAGVVVLICAPAVVIFGGEFVNALELEDLPMTLRIWIAIMLLAVAGLLYLGWRFFRAMQAIVRSVGYGDPFISENADRLTEMAWLFLALNVLSVPVAALGIYIARTAGEAPGTMDAGFDLGNLLTILILFILARVFRKGTAMREDLEGTV